MITEEELREMQLADEEIEDEDMLWKDIINQREREREIRLIKNAEKIAANRKLLTKNGKQIKYKRTPLEQARFMRENAIEGARRRKEAGYKYTGKTKEELSAKRKEQYERDKEYYKMCARAYHKHRREQGMRRKENRWTEDKTDE